MAQILTRNMNTIWILIIGTSRMTFESRITWSPCNKTGTSPRGLSSRNQRSCWNNFKVKTCLAFPKFYFNWIQWKKKKPISMNHKNNELNCLTWKRSLPVRSKADRSTSEWSRHSSRKAPSRLFWKIILIQYNY